MTDLLASVATIGHVTHDLYEAGIEPGGGAFYSACAYRALGHPTTLVTTVGEDFRCDDAISGLQPIARRLGETTTFHNLERDGEPRRQLIHAVAPDVAPHRLGADLIHITPVFGEVDLSAWRAVVRPSLVALSVQGFMRARGPRLDDPVGRWQRGELPPMTQDTFEVAPRQWRPTDAELDSVNIVCMSEEDLSGQSGLGARLRSRVRHGCLTRGRRGAWVWDGDESWWIGTYGARTVDPTGAGDVFAAVFASALVSGFGAEEAGCRAAAGASVVVEGVGAARLDRLSTELEVRSESIASRREGIPI